MGSVQINYPQGRVFVLELHSTLTLGIAEVAAHRLAVAAASLRAAVVLVDYTHLTVAGQRVWSYTTHQTAVTYLVFHYVTFNRPGLGLAEFHHSLQLVDFWLLRPIYRKADADVFLGPLLRAEAQLRICLRRHHRGVFFWLLLLSDFTDMAEQRVFRVEDALLASVDDGLPRLLNQAPGCLARLCLEQSGFVFLLPLDDRLHLAALVEDRVLFIGPKDLLAWLIVKLLLLDWL